MTAETRVGTLAEINGWLREELRGAAAARSGGRPMGIALSGGSVATDCFPALATVDLDWAGVRFVWADERAVAPSDPESNFRAADERWFRPAGVPDTSVLRMPGELPDLSAAARVYEATLEQTFGPAPALDLALLGMGPDGHVASLFPGHPVLHERERLVAAVQDSPKPPPRRLTLTLPMLARTRRAVLIVLGESKAESLHTALTEADSQLPAAQLLRETGRPLVLADEGAARLLART